MNLLNILLIIAGSWALAGYLLLLISQIPAVKRRLQSYGERSEHPPALFIIGLLLVPAFIVDNAVIWLYKRLLKG